MNQLTAIATASATTTGAKVDPDAFAFKSTLGKEGSVSSPSSGLDAVYWKSVGGCS